ncbi:MAG: nuclear transport factor 2 family protein [Acidimicrobiia bacterium]
MKPSPEIEAIVRRFMAARARADFDGVSSLTSDSEFALTIGSDQHEWVRGPQEVGPIVRAQWNEMPKHEPEILRLEAYEEGAVGWAALEEKRTYADGLVEIVRLTFVFQMEAGSWKIVHTHFSYPVPNRIPLTATLSELLGSLAAVGREGLAGQVSGSSTLVFTDVVDSTALTSSIGDQAWSRAIDDHLSTLSLLVDQQGGSTVKTLGDGGMYVFGAASPALRSAIEIQRAAAATSEPKIRVRIGVHSGDVLKTEDDYVGLTVSKAARVAGAAHGGQILVSDTTVGMVNPASFEFGPRFMVELKGLEGTHSVSPLIWEPAASDARA